MIVSEKIHFLYTTFLHFVKIERMKDSLIYSLYFVNLLGEEIPFWTRIHPVRCLLSNRVNTDYQDKPKRK